MSAHVRIERWLSEPLGREVELSLRRLAESEGVRQIAVMPDVHLAEEVCNGVVVATEGLLYPRAVGGDIGCGMAALAFHVEAAAMRDERRAAQVLTALYEAVPASRHGATVRELPEALERAPLSAGRLERLKRREGRAQLGTLGSGNHFLELQADADDRLWVMLHSGSRGIGQSIFAHHLERAAAEGKPYCTPGSAAMRPASSSTTPATPPSASAGAPT